MPRNYRYCTDIQWALLDAAIKGKLNDTPPWAIHNGSIAPLLDPAKRGWLYINDSGQFAVTPHGQEAWERRRHAEIPYRSTEGHAYRSGKITDRVLTLLSGRAVKSIGNLYMQHIEEVAKTQTPNKKKSA